MSFITKKNIRSLSLRTALGLGFFILTSVLWCLFPFVSYIFESTEEKARIYFYWFIVAQGTWYICLLLLGKDIIQFSKDYVFKMLKNLN